MKYADKIWKYFNFDSVDLSAISGGYRTYTRKVSIKISGEDDKPLVSAFFILIFLMIVPTIMTVMLSVAFGLESRFFTGVLIMITNVVIPFLLLGFRVGLHNENQKNLTPLLRNIDIYKRDLPSKLKPAHVFMLLYDGQINSIAVAATLLDLIDRGYLEILRSASGHDKSGFFSTEKMTLVLTKKPQDDLLRYEKYLINWFIKGYGDGKQVDNYTIKSCLENVTKGIIPADAFEHFQALVAMTFPFEIYYKRLNREHGSEKNPTNPMTTAIIVAFTIGFLPIPFITAPLAAFVFSSAPLSNKKYVLTQRGVDERDSWLDLKKYLEDFTYIKEKKIEDVQLYNFYLVYSIVLSANKKVTKDISTFFGEALYTQDYESMVEIVNGIENRDLISEDIYNYGFSEYKLTKEDIKEIEKDIEEERAKYDIDG